MSKFFGTYIHACDYEPVQYVFRAGAGADAKSGTFAHMFQEAKADSCSPGAFDITTWEATGTWKLKTDSIDLEYETVLCKTNEGAFNKSESELKYINAGKQSRAPLNIKINATSGQLDLLHETFKFTPAADSS